MDLQLLEAFIAVAETQSFSLAAERIHLTQPAVSKRIALLESVLDCRLFDRIARNITLTEAGTTLLPKAHQLLQQVQDIKQQIHDLSGSTSGTLRLAISHHIGLHRLPPTLKAFANQYPAVTTDIEFMDSEQAYEGVLQGHFELAVITLAPIPHPKIAATEVWPDPLTFMAAKDHKLAAVDSLSFATLNQHPAILPGIGTYTGKMARQLFEQQGIPIPKGMSTNYLETIRMMVSIGLGWSLLPKSMMRDDLVELSLPDIHIARQLGYIHHTEKSLSNAAGAFITLLNQLNP